MITAQTMVDYWFGKEAKPRWFDSTEEFEARLRERFLAVCQQAARGELADWERAGLEDNLKFARHHHGFVERFGRFLHRNAILGRQSTAEEKAWLASDAAFTG